LRGGRCDCRTGRRHGCGCLFLAAQCRLQSRHRCLDLLRVAGCVGCFQSTRGFQYRPVALAQGSGGLFALLGLPVEGFIDRLAERVPQLLLVLAIQRHALRLGLPALLQGLDGVHPKLRLGAQRLGLIDHRMTTIKALLLDSLQRHRRRLNGLAPHRLQFGKCLLAQMPGVAPACVELMQDPVEPLPVVVLGRGVGARPGLEFLDQRQPLRLVFGRLGLDLVEPGFHHLVGLVAGVVEALPHGVIRHPALVGLLPLLAQGAQLLLHLPAAIAGLGWLGLLAFGGDRVLEQALGLGHQFLAQLIGPPTLPAFQLARRSQSRVGLVFQLVVDQLAVFFQRIAQGIGRTGAGFAMAFTDFLL